MFQNLIHWFQTLPAGRREVIPYFILMLAMCAAYANIFPGSFILEDNVLVVRNDFLRDWHYLPAIITHQNYAGAHVDGVFYRPVTILLYLLVYQMFGLSTAAFHGLNFSVHLLNAGLMYRLGRKLGFTMGAAFSATLLWGVHPLHTQDVTFISSTGEVVWTTFALLGLLTLLPDFTPRKICMAAIFYLLGFGAKEGIVVFPALTVACLFVISKDRLKPSLYIKTWPFWLLSIACMAILLQYFNFSISQGSPIDPSLYKYNLPNRIFTSLAAVATYFSLMAWPTCLHLPRTFPILRTFWAWPVLTGAGLVMCALVQVILAKGTRGIPLTFGIFWFAAVLSPMTGILVPIDALFSEGWMYMPTIGLALGVAQTLATYINGLQSRKAPIAAAAGVIALAVAFGTKTHFQNQVYDNPGVFALNSLGCGEDLADTHNNLGIYYLLQNDFDKAIEQFKIVIARPGIRTPPMMAGLYINIAMAYLRVPADVNGVTTVQGLVAALPHTHQIPEAIDALNKAMKLDPSAIWARKFLDILYDYQKENDPLHK